MICRWSGGTSDLRVAGLLPRTPESEPARERERERERGAGEEEEKEREEEGEKMGITNESMQIALHTHFVG